MRKTSLSKGMDLIRDSYLEGGSHFESLEARQMLSASSVLPQNAIYVPYGDGSVAALRDSYVLTFEGQRDAQRADQLARDAAARLGVEVDSIHVIGRGSWAELRTRGSIPRELAQRVADEMPDVRSIEPNYLYKTASAEPTPRSPDDTLYSNGDLWHLNNSAPGAESGRDIDATRAWGYSIGSRNVVVAVIDSGIDLDHPDLFANIWINTREIAGNGIDDDNNGFTDDVNGYDFGDSDSSPNDEQGHGTQVAGLIGAVGDNTLGVVGVNWTVQMMALKVTERISGLPNMSAVLAAWDYATAMKAAGVNVVVANASYALIDNGFFVSTTPQTERDAIARFTAAGAVAVLPSGNGGFNLDAVTNNIAAGAPNGIGVPGVITVAATDRLDRPLGVGQNPRVLLTNVGFQRVDVAAPGTELYTTRLGGTYGVVGGTSFSAAITSGIVALLYSVKPSMSPVEAREALINGSDLSADLQGVVRSSGRVNAARSIRLVLSDGPRVRTLAPGQIISAQVFRQQLQNTFTIQFSEPTFAPNLTSASITLQASNSPTQRVSCEPVAGTNNTQWKVRFVQTSTNEQLAEDTYTLTILGEDFVDSSGNKLGGDAVSGVDFVATIRIVSPTDVYEAPPNNQISSATPVVFDASGQANLIGMNIGSSTGLPDVDLFRIDIPRGGVFKAEVIAQRLEFANGFDSYLRLFDAAGRQIAFNDQFFGNDSFIDFWLPAGGTYYVGVSSFRNPSYDSTLAQTAPIDDLNSGRFDLRLQVDLIDEEVQSYVDSIESFVTIPARDLTGIESFIEVLDPRQILDVNLNILVDHDWISDLQISLIAPNGVETSLIRNRGGNRDDLGSSPNSMLAFDDEAIIPIAQAIWPSSGSLTGTFRPEEALSRFDGLSAAGRWKLRIVDGVNIPFGGRLIQWDLQIKYLNDIFGSAESNDTVTTATVLNEFNTPAQPGIGSETRTGVIGDGAFGRYDRDFFRFQAVGGGSLTAKARATSPTESGTPTLNTALRLFDRQGVEIINSNPAGSLDSTIEFVFPFSGEYFIAVSDGTNVSYSPNGVNLQTDSASGSTGGYELEVLISRGVTDGGHDLVGDLVKLSITPTGAFAAPNPSATEGGFGMSFAGVNFLNNLEQFFGAGFDQFVLDPRLGREVLQTFTFMNQGPSGENQMAFALSVSGDNFNRRVSAVADFRGVRVERVISFGVKDSFFAVDVFFTNNTGRDLTNLRWSEGFNPDQGLGVESSNRRSAFTVNKVSGKSVRASFYDNNKPLYDELPSGELDFTKPSGLSVQMTAADSESRATARIIPGYELARNPFEIAGLSAPLGAARNIVPPLPSDPGDILFYDDDSYDYSNPQWQNDPNDTNYDPRWFFDDFVAMDFDLATLSADERKSVRYFVMFGKDHEIQATRDKLNNGTGSGHLAANPAAPAPEVLQVSATDPNSTIPSLPYRQVFPEGFFGPNLSTFLPLVNLTNQRATVSVIARFEWGTRDQVLITPGNRDNPLLTPAQRAVFTLEPNSRDGLTIVTPELFNLGTALIRPEFNGIPYAIEVRSDRPVAATFSHYDQNLSGVGRALGESFTTRTSETWNFPDVQTDGLGGLNDFVTFFNPTNDNLVITTRFYPQNGGAPFIHETIAEPNRRSGIALELLDGKNNATGSPDPNELNLPIGKYGIMISTTAPIVSAISKYSTNGSVEGSIANVGSGRATGAIPVGQVGLGATSEQITVLNPGSVESTVLFTFLFSSGDSYRASLRVPAQSRRDLDVSSLTGFGVNDPYSVTYKSTTTASLNSANPIDAPVAVSLESNTFGESVGTSAADKAYTTWAFSDGFRSAAPEVPNELNNLRIYNPTLQSTVFEVTINFYGYNDLSAGLGGPGSETVRRVVSAKQVVELDIDDFITGARRLQNQVFGVVVRSQNPIVASMLHTDNSLSYRGAAFATLGTPYGLSTEIV